MNSVDISVPCLVIECGHCGGARAHWHAPQDGQPPDLWFENFPRNGRVMMSRKTVLVACERCQGQLDVIRKEYGRTLEL